jgi:2-furoyl-CoA dehydrogenase 2Fe-2S iron sulfur subunit
MLKVAAGSEHEISFRLNGKLTTARCFPRMHLADFLRQRCHKTGTHVGCEHGVCGACTVLVNGKATRSCLIYAIQVRDCDVRTVEGLAEGAILSDLQGEFRRHFALQCGFCTPGILMSATDFLSHVPEPSEEQVREFLSGHICRCTGYDGIVKAILATARLRQAMSKQPAGNDQETANSGS